MQLLGSYSGLALQTKRLLYAPGEILRQRRYREEGKVVPPRWLQFVGGGGFDTLGERFLGHFQKIGGLKPHERVLDVGCGVGRMALPLTRYIERPGCYAGFDIVKPGIDWCNQNIAAHHPRFRFNHADIRNPAYNAGGTVRAEWFRFPYPDASFDFAFLTSVFTHMPPAEVQNYLREIARVLKPGGRCFATFFLLNADSRQRMATAGSQYNFSEAREGYSTVAGKIDQAAVAYDEECMIDMLRSAGFSAPALHYGAWCGRPDFVDGQDIAVAVKAT